MKLIDNWKEGWTWLSVHTLVILAAIPIIWGQIPEQWKAALPSSSLVWITAAVAVCGIVARLFKEGKLSLSNIGDSKSWFSVWALFFAGAIPMIWYEMPADVIAALPQQITESIAAIIPVFGLIGRFIDQSGDKLQV